MDNQQQQFEALDGRDETQPMKSSTEENDKILCAQVVSTTMMLELSLAIEIQCRNFPLKPTSTYALQVAHYNLHLVSPPSVNSIFMYILPSLDIGLILNAVGFLSLHSCSCYHHHHPS